MHVCDLADGRVARAGGVDEHDCVTAPAGCAWTTSESATISITGGASGSGNGTVTYSVTANPTITARNVTMTIAGQSFDVTQAGQPCTYTLTPAGASVVATASTGSVAVAALGGCAWTATSSAAWVTITSGASGSGNATVGYSVAANLDCQSAHSDADDRRPIVHDYPGGARRARIRRARRRLRSWPPAALARSPRRRWPGASVECDDQRALDHDHRHGHRDRQRDVQLHRRRQCRSDWPQRDDCGGRPDRHGLAGSRAVATRCRRRASR